MSQAPERGSALMIAIAQVSDVHLDGSPERARRARAALDAVLVTGDIADHGRPSEYEEARTILSAPCPVMFLPGNHDERDAFRRGLLSDRVAAAPGDARPEAPLDTGAPPNTGAPLNTGAPPSPKAQPSPKARPSPKVPPSPEAPLNQ